MAWAHFLGRLFRISRMLYRGFKIFRKAYWKCLGLRKLFKRKKIKNCIVLFRMGAIGLVNWRRVGRIRHRSGVSICRVFMLDGRMSTWFRRLRRGNMMSVLISIMRLIWVIEVMKTPLSNAVILYKIKDNKKAIRNYHLTWSKKVNPHKNQLQNCQDNLKWV